MTVQELKDVLASIEPGTIITLADGQMLGGVQPSLQDPGVIYLLPKRW